MIKFPALSRSDVVFIMLINVKVHILYLAETSMEKVSIDILSQVWSGVVLDCIDSWSLHPFMYLLITLGPGCVKKQPVFSATAH